MSSNSNLYEAESASFSSATTQDKSSSSPVSRSVSKALKAVGSASYSLSYVYPSSGSASASTSANPVSVSASVTSASGSVSASIPASSSVSASVSASASASASSSSPSDQPLVQPYVQDITLNNYLRPPTSPAPDEINIIQESSAISPSGPPLIHRQDPPRPEPFALVGRKATISGKSSASVPETSASASVSGSASGSASSSASIPESSAQVSAGQLRPVSSSSQRSQKTNSVLSARRLSNSNKMSQVEAAILRSSIPIELEDTEEINVNGVCGIYANKTEVNNWKGEIPISNYSLNEDPSPEIITKKSDQPLEYVQELAIRYLRPPTPPAPGEIIITQESNAIIPPAPPLIVRQQPPRPETPEPLVIREAPPQPPALVGRKVITISGKSVPPPPRKVVIERLAPLPTKPQSVVIERWLPYAEVKRRVIFNRPAERDPVIVKPKNIIVQWEAPQVLIKKEYKYLGVIKANPVEYVKRYGPSLKVSSELPEFVLEIKNPEGIVLAAEFRRRDLHELEGDIQALKLVDLDKEGLSGYKNYLRSSNSSLRNTPIASVATTVSSVSALISNPTNSVSASSEAVGSASALISVPQSVAASVLSSVISSSAPVSSPTVNSVSILLPSSVNITVAGLKTPVLASTPSSAYTSASVSSTPAVLASTSTSSPSSVVVSSSLPESVPISTSISQSASISQSPLVSTLLPASNSVSNSVSASVNQNGSNSASIVQASVAPDSSSTSVSNSYNSVSPQDSYPPALSGSIFNSNSLPSVVDQSRPFSASKSPNQSSYPLVPSTTPIQEQQTSNSYSPSSIAQVSMPPSLSSGSIQYPSKPSVSAQASSSSSGSIVQSRPASSIQPQQSVTFTSNSLQPNSVILSQYSGFISPGYPYQSGIPSSIPPTSSLQGSIQDQTILSGSNPSLPASHYAGYLTPISSTQQAPSQSSFSAPVSNSAAPVSLSAPGSTNLSNSTSASVPSSTSTSAPPSGSASVPSSASLSNNIYVNLPTVVSTSSSSSGNTFASISSLPQSSSSLAPSTVQSSGSYHQQPSISTVSSISQPTATGAESTPSSVPVVSSSPNFTSALVPSFPVKSKPPSPSTIVLTSPISSIRSNQGSSLSLIKVLSSPSSRLQLQHLPPSSYSSVISSLTPPAPSPYNASPKGQSSIQLPVSYVNSPIRLPSSFAPSVSSSPKQSITDNTPQESVSVAKKALSPAQSSTVSKNALTPVMSSSPFQPSSAMTTTSTSLYPVPASASNYHSIPTLSIAPSAQAIFSNSFLARSLYDRPPSFLTGINDTTSASLQFGSVPVESNSFYTRPYSSRPGSRPGTSRSFLSTTLSPIPASASIASSSASFSPSGILPPSLLTVNSTLATVSNSAVASAPDATSTPSSTQAESIPALQGLSNSASMPSQSSVVSVSPSQSSQVAPEPTPVFSPATNNALSSLIERIFQSIDINNTGKISVSNAERILLRLNSRLGRRYGEDDVRAFFNALDVNNDGLLDLDEFKKAFLNLTI